LAWWQRANEGTTIQVVNQQNGQSPQILKDAKFFSSYQCHLSLHEVIRLSSGSVLQASLCFHKEKNGYNGHKITFCIGTGPINSIKYLLNIVWRFLVLTATSNSTLPSLFSDPPEITSATSPPTRLNPAGVKQPQQLVYLGRKLFSEKTTG